MKNQRSKERWREYQKILKIGIVQINYIMVSVECISLSASFAYVK